MTASEIAVPDSAVREEVKDAHKNDLSLIHEVETDPVLRLFLNSVTDQAVFTVDPNGIILTWSEGCRRMKRYTAEEAIGQHFRMLYTTEDAQNKHPESNLEMALEHGEYQEERVRLRKGGERFIAEVSIYPIKQEGRLVAFAKVVKDVSERKRCEVESQICQERLKESHEELEGFCHSIAHDLRSPIRAIVSNCRIVQEDYTASLPEEARVHLTALVKNSLRIAQFVDDLLAFARFGNGEINKREIDASELAESMVSDIKLRCHNGTASIEIQPGMEAYADPFVLELVLRNLIENSCKYSLPGVSVRLGMEVHDGKSIYHVQDDGIGFSMEYVRKIFEPFQRLHRDDAYSGTGIGLANVKRIIERHGGQVWAESEPGKGSTFFFTLS